MLRFGREGCFSGVRFCRRIFRRFLLRIFAKLAVLAMITAGGKTDEKEEAAESPHC